MEKSWQDEFKNSYRSSKELSDFLNAELSQTSYKTFIPKKFAQKIKDGGPSSALWKQFVPSAEELNVRQGLTDPIGDQIFEVKGGIIHRYKSRILYNPTTVCPINCRYCFRKNELEENIETFKPSLQRLKGYLQKNTNIEEVILTGGDPLILSDKKLTEIFEVISSFKHIKYIRLHSRTPIIIPSRLNSGLLNLFSKYEKSFESISLVIHTNHESELSQELKEAIKPFKRFNLLSQSVLLKDINDDPKDLIELFKKLNSFGVRPYYLHHPDQVKGAMHFYLPIEEGRKIYGRIRDDLPGWLIPHYIIDSPSGKGKNFAYNPEKIEFSGFILDRFNQEYQH
jgi:lysine 2,3-aminomutase